MSAASAVGCADSTGRAEMMGTMRSIGKRISGRRAG